MKQIIFVPKAKCRRCEFNDFRRCGVDFCVRGKCRYGAVAINSFSEDLKISANPIHTTNAIGTGNKTNGIGTGNTTNGIGTGNKTNGIGTGNKTNGIGTGNTTNAVATANLKNSANQENINHSVNSTNSTNLTISDNVVMKKMRLLQIMKPSPKMRQAQKTEDKTAKSDEKR